MKQSLFIIAIVAQFAAGSVFAQTTATTTTEATTGTTTGTFGSDWTSTMGTAMMGDDGMTVRSATEIATQFDTLSDTDKEMLRRDCMMHMQTAVTADANAEATVAPDASATTGATDGAVTGDTAAVAGAEGAMGMTVTAEQMDQICAATKDK